MYVTLILLTVNVNTIVQLKMRFMRIQLLILIKINEEFRKTMQGCAVRKIC